MGVCDCATLHCCLNTNIKAPQQPPDTQNPIPGPDPETPKNLKPTPYKPHPLNSRNLSFLASLRHQSPRSTQIISSYIYSIYIYILLYTGQYLRS